MILSTVDDNNLFPRSMKAKCALAAFNIFDEIAERHGSLNFDRAAARPNVGDIFDDVDSRRLADISDHFDRDRHISLPLLNTTEQRGNGPATKVKCKNLNGLTVPFLPTASFERQSA